MATGFEKLDNGRKSAWSKDVTGMLNEEKKLVDPYIPRKCEATNRILFANDRASVQIVIAEVYNFENLIQFSLNLKLFS